MHIICISILKALTHGLLLTATTIYFPTCNQPSVELHSPLLLNLSHQLPHQTIPPLHSLHTSVCLVFFPLCKPGLLILILQSSAQLLLTVENRLLEVLLGRFFPRPSSLSFFFFSFYVFIHFHAPSSRQCLWPSKCSINGSKCADDNIF